MSGADELMAVRFACSPAWETIAALRTFVDGRARSYHQPWLQLVQGRIGQLDLAPVLTLQPLRGSVPDFLSPPPRVPWPSMREQIGEMRRTSPEQVIRDLEACRASVDEQPRRRQIDAFLADPVSARDLLATRMQDAWRVLVAPFWMRIRTLLARDIAERSRTLSQRGLRSALHGLDPRIRWTKRGLSIANRFRDVVNVDERGLVLMPSAFAWPHVSVVVDEPWQPTIIYPARGIAELWQSPAAPSEPLARLLGRTRAHVLTILEQPSSTNAVAARIELSPAGASRHLLALRDAGLIAGARHGHEVLYARTALGSALLRGTGPAAG